MERIRASGFSLLEVCSSPPHLDYHNAAAVREAAARAVELGMEIYSFHAPFGREIDISSLNAASRESSVEEILVAVDAAAILGVHYFVIHPGPEDVANASVEERICRLDHVVQSLCRIARRCEEAGIGCVIENKLPHLIFGNVRDIQWILEAIDSPRVGACLDTGHASLSGELPPLIHMLAPQIWMIHAHDNNGHADDHFPPGDGRINWHSTFKELMHVHFHGSIILELASGTDADATMTDARRGRAYLRGIAKKIAVKKFSR